MPGEGARQFKIRCPSSIGDRICLTPGCPFLHGSEAEEEEAKTAQQSRKNGPTGVHYPAAITATKRSATELDTPSKEQDEKRRKNRVVERSTERQGQTFQQPQQDADRFQTARDRVDAVAISAKPAPRAEPTDPASLLMQTSSSKTFVQSVNIPHRANTSADTASTLTASATTVTQTLTPSKEETLSEKMPSQARHGLPNHLSTKISSSVKRVAHAMEGNGGPGKPPLLVPNAQAHTAHKTRQTIVNHYYNLFRHIYERVQQDLPEDLPAKHALLQEERILNATTNTASYKTMAATILGRLKKRPQATTMQAGIGLDGDVGKYETVGGDHVPTPPKDVPSEVRKVLARVHGHDLASLVLSLNDQKTMGYPLPETIRPKYTIVHLGPAQGSSTILHQQKEKCDRCGMTFVVKQELTQEDYKVCTYHWGPLRVNRNQVADDADLHNLLPFVDTADPSIPDGSHALDIIALDCEMGYTTIGMELIRLSVIDMKEEAVLDTLVRPTHPVLDLNSRFSGVTSLDGAIEFHLARQKLMALLQKSTIIIGHGLENDLRALRLLHGRVIDTVKLYPHPGGLPYRHSLKNLARKYLKIFIQNDVDAAGHDSAEDARAALELVALKVQKRT
ncbi:hypothetical protein BZG36_04387 [Bifiguratus adelaidae]|uniref:Exonuclease domain-containing protein n=1 Tax=Bifiguratus adelaidae TaxID=1938954 RepID=A0A261XVF7_9FUNG|nr:hypothetical protein BZG36_04387 [Bifiguratus adelaidae]